MDSTFDFGQALAEMKKGKKVSRRGWGSRAMWVHIQNPDKKSKMQRPYIYIKYGDGLLVPWTPNQIDLLKEDWVLSE